MIPTLFPSLPSDSVCIEPRHIQLMNIRAGKERPLALIWRLPWFKFSGRELLSIIEFCQSIDHYNKLDQATVYNLVDIPRLELRQTLRSAHRANVLIFQREYSQASMTQEP
jgi:hypothetical protein